MTLKTRATHKELEQESTRLAACLCAAIDATQQAEKYATKKKESALRFTSDNVSSMALSIYISVVRREKKEFFGK
jgi:hypothetical protein